MSNPFLLFCCLKPWRQIWIWYIELVSSRIISFPRGKPTNEIRILDDSTNTMRDYLQRANRKKWDVFLKEINGFMLNVTDQYCISPATSKGGFSCHPGDLSRKCHLCHGSCKSRKQDKRPPSSRYKTYSPKYRIMVCPYFVSQQTELIQSETPPTSITDLICKGTWSINEDVLFERCCFPLFFIIIILLIYLFSVIKKSLSFVDPCLYIGANSRNPKRDKRLPRWQEESFCRKERNQEQITKISGLPNEA